MRVALTPSSNIGTHVMAVSNTHRLVLSLVATLALSGAAHAADYSNASAYNAGYGMAAGAENKAADFSVRDENGNLTIINGMFASASNSQQSGVQSATATASGVGSQSGTGLGGTGGASNLNGSASAIGNSLNVVTTGNFNTVIVNSTQTNTGNQTASVVLNGQ